MKRERYQRIKICFFPIENLQFEKFLKNCLPKPKEIQLIIHRRTMRVIEKNWRQMMHMQTNANTYGSVTVAYGFDKTVSRIMSNRFNQFSSGISSKLHE